jgi:hypothetical protein
MGPERPRSSVKEVFSSPPFLVTLIIILSLALSLWIFLSYSKDRLPIFWEEEEGEVIDLGKVTFETLIVKITYPSKLARLDIKVSSETFGGRAAETVGDLIRAEWDNDKVIIGIVNDASYVFNTAELKNEQRLLNLSVKGFPANFTVGIFNVTYPNLMDPPDEFKRTIIKLIENQSFVRWLKDEGFSYSVENIRLASPFYWGESFFQELCWVNDIEVELSVEGLKVLCNLAFGEGFTIATDSDMAEKFLIPVGQDQDMNGICIYMYKHRDEYIIGTMLSSSDPYSSGRMYSMNEIPLSNGTNVWINFAATFTKETRVLTLNATSEEIQKAVKILERNRLTGRLMERGYDISFVKYVWQGRQAGPLQGGLTCAEEEIFWGITVDLDSERIEEISFSSFFEKLPLENLK